MIIDISDQQFKSIMNDEKLYLPIRWDGTDFSSTLEDVFHYYIKSIKEINKDSRLYFSHMRIDFRNIVTVCELIIKVVKCYLNGFPSKAYNSFEKVMNILICNPLKIYQKSVIEQFKKHESRYSNNDLLLYRVTSVANNKPYERTRVFKSKGLCVVSQ